jgi:hypothetical protein
MATVTSPAVIGVPGMEIDVSDDYRALGYPDQRKIARDSQGNLYVAYRKQFMLTAKTTSHIFVARSTDNGATWAVVNRGLPIEAVGDYNQRVPAIAVDGHDVIHVVWVGIDARNTSANERQIKYAHSTDGGNSWSGWIPVAQVDGYSGESLWQEHPVILATPRAINVAWQGRDPLSPKASQIKFSQSTDGGKTWSTLVNVAPSRSAGHSRPSLLASNDGRHLYILAYGEWEGRQQILWTDTTDGGADWGPWRAVAPSSNDQRHVSADVDEHDRVHVAWREDSPNTTDAIYYSVFEHGAWQPAAQVSGTGSKYNFFPSLAVGGGNVWIVWTATPDKSGAPEDDPHAGVIYFTRLTNSEWSRPTPVMPTVDHAIYPSLGTGLYRNTVGVDMVWMDNTTDVKVLRYGLLTVP